MNFSQPVYNFVSKLDLTKIKAVTFGGGIPRSGTTFAEAVIESSDDVLVLDEYMPLKGPEFGNFIAFQSRMIIAERQGWTDDAGLTWRHFSEQEDVERFLRFVIACLASTSVAMRFNKDPAKINSIFCKTPGCEGYVLPVIQCLTQTMGAKISARYLHFVRDPVSCARSNFEMPWSRGEIDEWLPHFYAGMEFSRASFEALCANGHPTAVIKAEALWSQETAWQEYQRLTHFIGAAPTTGSELPLGVPVDPWPADRRRMVSESITAERAVQMLADPRVATWCRTFGYGT
ncbi:MAG: hypothetical protein EON58_20365 [Alphaproteobacteria bacterium]|nr:MAG: hypothetical protein EON58_20365 [Alphaproteobacteria bacterium]